MTRINHENRALFVFLTIVTTKYTQRVHCLTVVC